MVELNQNGINVAVLVLAHSVLIPTVILGDLWKANRQMSLLSTTAKVTVIIPIFNSKRYLQRSLDSVFSQTYSNFEIIAVDDGSTDGSARVLERNQQTHPELRVITQENSGQGVARNRAIGEATGEFILFLDSDDYLDPQALELTVKRALKDNSDFVYFDWKLASRIRHRPKASNYYVQRALWEHVLLEGPDCDKLLETNSFFTVTALYRTDFLHRNNVRYGEGYIYEDNVFYALAANAATRVSLLHAPLYIIQPHSQSTTQTGKGTDRHYKGHIAALAATLERYECRSEESVVYLARYHLHKFIEYYSVRVPKEFRAAYTRDFLEQMSVLDISFCTSIPVSRYFRLFVKKDVFKKQKYYFMRTILEMRLRALKLTRSARKLKTRVRKFASKVKQKVSRLRSKFQAATVSAGNGLSRTSPAPLGSIVFVGFDHRYTGNSRYLFEQMIEDPRFEHTPIRFLTKSALVDDEHRVEPTRGYIQTSLRNADLVIIESWTPHWWVKTGTALWIQLWHGTPIKKMLFESNEPEIIARTPAHKVSKHRNIQRWDFLITDSPVGTAKLDSSMLFPRDRTYQVGYPRVKYLIDNQNNDSEKMRISASLDLTESLKDRMVVLYAPTWRDYNYGKKSEEADYSYILDVSELAQQLGDEYVVLFHDHSYLKASNTEPSANWIDVSEHEMQELLLLTDIVVSDFSSVIFDAAAIDLPFVLYVTDFEAFEASRGVYEDVWEELMPHAVSSVEAVVQAVRAPQEFQMDPEVKLSYTYNSTRDLLDFVDTVGDLRATRDW